MSSPPAELQSPPIENFLATVLNAVPNLFALNYTKTWLRSQRCASDTQTRTASQKSTVKQVDPVYKFL